MRSELFGSHLESTGPGNAAHDSGRMALQNPRLLRVRLDGEVMARQGSMVAYQGEMDFAYQGAGGIGRLLKRALTGEGVPLMRVTGRGDLFLAEDAREIHLLTLEGDSVTVNGENILAFDPSLEWDIRAVPGASIAAGGLFNTVFTGHGQLAVTAHGTPVVLSVDAPTYIDVASAVAWSTGLQTSFRRTAGLSSLIGRGSGEAFQIAFAGQGFVVVQASEGPTVPPHSHGN